MIKGILIDLDNTLYSYDICHQAGLQSSFEELKHTIKNLSFSEFKNKYQNIQNELKFKLTNTASSHHRLLYFQHVLENLDTFSAKLSLDLFNSYWNSFYKEMTLFEGVLDFLKNSKLKNIPLIIVTDMVAQTQFEKLYKLGIDQFISAVVTSEEAGVEKPNEKIFNIALSKMNLNAKNVIMIGDSYEKDIMGAKNLGIHAYWLDIDKNFTNDYDIANVSVCSSFKEINELIK